MGASINGVPFFVNPKGVSWAYSMQAATHKTIGGKVIQLYGWSMGDLVITGEFGRDGIDRQLAFFRQMQEISTSQAPTPDRPYSEPVRFLWPEKKWDFWVFVKSLMQAGAGVSIETSERLHNPKYTLTLFVYEDNGEIVKAAAQSAAVAYLKRLSAGLGWRQSEWNGPINVAELQERLRGSSVYDYAFAQYGVTPTVTAEPGGG